MKKLSIIFGAAIALLVSADTVEAQRGPTAGRPSSRPVRELRQDSRAQRQDARLREAQRIELRQRAEAQARVQRRAAERQARRRGRDDHRSRDHARHGRRDDVFVEVGIGGQRSGHYEWIERKVWRQGYYKTVQVPARYVTRYDECGRPYRVCIRRACTKRVWVDGCYEVVRERVWVEDRCDTRRGRRRGGFQPLKGIRDIIGF